jgi:hypothetical protein
VLSVGDRVRFSHPTGERRYWWDVRAVDERYVVLTRQANFKPRGEMFYTIIDWGRGLRGPCNLGGQGWDFGEDLDGDARKLLRALNAHLEAERWFKGKPAGTSRPMIEAEVEVSYRNNVRIEIAETRSC